MSDLSELYQEVILDHSRSPRNFGFPPAPNRSGEGYNPLCGDRITLKAAVEGGVIREIGFEGQGCAISTAAASTMTEAVKGKTLAEAWALFDAYHALVTGQGEPLAIGFEGDDEDDSLDRLLAFAGVASFPMRVKCATLAWHTLKAALFDGGKPVTTE
jgi:nitrogen fixation protein NifU and related proteins